MAIILLIDVCISLLKNKFIVEPKKKRAELMRQPDINVDQLAEVENYLFTALTTYQLRI
jgi:hypothetical protein